MPNLCALAYCFRSILIHSLLPHFLLPRTVKVSSCADQSSLHAGKQPPAAVGLRDLRLHENRRRRSDFLRLCFGCRGLFAERASHGLRRRKRRVVTSGRHCRCLRIRLHRWWRRQQQQQRQQQRHGDRRLFFQRRLSYFFFFVVVVSGIDVCSARGRGSFAARGGAGPRAHEHSATVGRGLWC